MKLELEGKIEQQVAKVRKFLDECGLQITKLDATLPCLTEVEFCHNILGEFVN